MTVMNIWLLGRDGKIKNYTESESFEINYDYLSNTTSSFVLRDNIGVQPNDFIVAKESESNKPAFFGVVSSLENGKVNANQIINLLNFEIVMERGQTGDSLEDFLKQLITSKLIGDDSKIVKNIVVDVKTKTKFFFIFDGNGKIFISQNLADYFFLAFKKYGVVWQFDDIVIDENTKTYTIHTSLVRYDKTINVKNNSYTFLNWDVYERPIGPDLENKAVVFDTKYYPAQNMGTVYYLRSDNTLTQDVNDNVYKPTKDKVVLYDSGTEHATPLELASNALLGNSYSHEISFDLKMNSRLLTMDDIVIGYKYNIAHNDSLYQSILTGFKINDDGTTVSLKFGNYRSNFDQVLRNISRR